MEEQIRNIVSPEAQAQIDKLNVSLQQNVDLLMKSLAASKGLDSTFRGTSGTQAFETALNELIAAQKKFYEEGEKTKRVVGKISLEHALASEAVKAHNADMREQARVQLQLGGEYKKLERELKTARDAYKDLAAAERENTAEGKAMLASIQALDFKLKQIDASVGQFQKNVGNYGREMYSFTMVLREAPAFANSLQTGLMGISNNLPMLADDIKKMRDSGKSWTEVFKMMTSTLFSFGGIVTIAVTALTFLPQILNAMSTSAEKATKNYKSFGEVQKEAAKASTEERLELEALLSVAKDESKSKSERSAAIKKMNDILPDYIGSIDMEKIKTGEADKITKEYINTLNKKALAQAYLTKLTELNNKLIDAETSSIADNVKWYNYLWNAVKNGMNFEKGISDNIKDGIANRKETVKGIKDEVDALQKKFQEDLKNGKAILDLDKTLKDEKKKGRDLEEANRRAIYEIQKRYLEEEKAAAKQRADDEKLDLASRLVAQDQYQQASRKLIELEATFEKSAKGLTKKEIERIEVDKQVSLTALVREGLKSRRDLWDASLKAEQELIDKWNKEFEEKEEQANKEKIRLRQKLVDDAKNIYQKFNNNLDTEYAKDLQNLTDNLVAQKITLEEYNKKKQDLDLRYNTDKISNDIEMYKTIISNLKGQGQDVAEFEKQLTDLIVKQQDLRAKNAEKNSKKTTKQEEDKAKKIRELQKQLTSELISLGQSLATAQFENEKNELREKLDGIEKRKAAEIEAVNASTLSQQEKADRIKIIESRAQAEKEAIERRNRELSLQQARFARAFQIANIIANTAQAVVGALAPPPVGLGPVAGIPVAALIGAIGAAQIAKILATPIPRYAVGTEDHKGGLAIVGEKGVEKVVYPDGSEGFTPDKSTLTWLPKHAKVIPNHKLEMDELKASFKTKTYSNTSYSARNQAQPEVPWTNIQKELRGIKSAISNQKGVQINQTWRGIEVSYRDSLKHISWVNKIKD